MTRQVRNPKEFCAGVVYMAFGLAAVLIGRDYSFGTGVRMGPGYFPVVLGGLLTLLGVVAIGRSFLKEGAGVGAIAWKPLLLVVGGTVLFGGLLRGAGLPVALLALILVSAAASRQFRFEWRAALALIALIMFCAVVFEMALGVPLPLVGAWLGA